MKRTLCKDCAAWDRFEEGEPEGACGLHPPRADGSGTHWPQVDEDDWCFDAVPKLNSLEDKA